MEPEPKSTDTGLAQALAALDVGDETFREPLCIDPPDPWLGHVPFVFWLFRALRPSTVVEFSANSPVSHLASCQAAEAEDLPARIYAIGGWTSGSDGIDEHGARYGRFACPIADAGQALGLVADGSVDLLIIRGAAFDMERAFASWRPKLSSRAVLLLDGIAHAPSVRAFWRKLAGEHPHFEFADAAGLGVAALGSDLPAPLRTLFALSDDAATAWVRRFFAATGAACMCRGALAAERRQARAGRLEHEIHLAALRTRHRARLEEVYRHLSTWLDQSLERYDHWMRGEIHRSRVEAAQLVDNMARELAQARFERDAARHQIGAMQASTSWRVTAPLRRVVGGGASPGAEPGPEPIATTAPPDPGSAPASPPPDLPPPRDWRPAMPDLFELRAHQAASRIAVVLCLRHAPDLAAALDALGNLAEPFDLFVLLVAGVSDHVAPIVRSRFPAALVFEFPDRGGVLAFLAVAETGVLFQYALVCRIETRLPEPEACAALIAAFDRDPDLGLVVADEHASTVAPAWEHLRPWLSPLGLSPDTKLPDNLLSGNVFWIRPFVLRDLVALRLSQTPDPAATDAIAALFPVVCISAGLKVQSASASLAATPPGPPAASPPLIAFYLPQFHPTPENDRWWGPGFTEWTNVTSARPQFPGHRQPRLPGELGFTDLRLAETREAQAALARAYGITAFCYYYYWFGRGRRLLHRPLDEVRRTGSPDFPFLICWANEPWSRRWDGAANDVLMPQDYAPGWVEAFAADAAPILQDPRYFRMRDGRPLLLIYRVMQIPRPRESLAQLREHLLALGTGPVHLACGSFSLRGLGDEPLPDSPEAIGCDSFFQFPPHGLQPVPVPRDEIPPEMTGEVFDYAKTVDAAVQRLPSTPAHVHPGVMAAWDNTARRGADAHVYRGATPCHFRRWLRATIRHVQEGGDGPVFINAWNEWAEGTYLEPDRDFGRGWLEAVRSALGSTPR